MNQILRKQSYAILIFLGCLYSNNILAQPLATFEVGEAILPAHTTTATEATPFTTITFDGVFASPPNVFTMTPEFGDGVDDDPCTIRIRNVTTTGFDATCLEPLNEDRNSPGLTFEYLAIVDGGVTVPIVGGGSYELQSSCENVINQQYGVNCDDCVGPETSLDANFISAFTNAPALLTQVQTTNNLNLDATAPTDEPEFLDTTVVNVTANDFDLALELMEAGSGQPTVTEEICYLAAEIDGCVSLDFSGIGGPATPVAFQAIESGDTITGHDSTCTGPTFAAGCFSNTPLALAKQNTRDGGDGGFLRRCTVSTTTATFIFDEDRVSNPERNHVTENASVFAFGEVFTTPVTLNSAKVSLIGRAATFTWETTTETFHLGFNLWGETSEGWVQLNNRLISGNGADTDEPQSYRQTRRLSREQRDEITQFGISSVDSTGYEEFYGPFSEGQEYGEEANDEPVDWTSTRTEFERSMRERGFTKVNNRWRRLSEARQTAVEKRNLGIGRTVFDLNVDTSGIHSVSGSDLIALNPAWNRLRLNRIALTLNGDAVPRHIISADDRLDADDRIVFNVSDVNGEDTPFIDHYTYRLLVDGSKSTDATVYDGRDVDGQTVSEEGLISQTLTAKKLHSALLTTGDPWYDARLLSVGNPASIEYTTDFALPINEARGGQLELVLFGSLDFPGQGDDHHVQVTVNGELVHDVSFDGLTGFGEQIQLPDGLLKNSGNTVEITVVGDTGFAADVVLVDEVRLSAFSSLVDDTRLFFDFADSDEVNGYRVSGTDGMEVYAYTTGGLLSVVQGNVTDGGVEFSRLPYEASANYDDVELRYAASHTWPTPVISVTTGEDLHSQEADYLIVAHPSFMGDDLNDFAEYKANLGYNVRIVDWLEIVNTYGHGNNTPEALNNFLKEANQEYSTENVLIVGGHTSDYFGITDESVVNFIPGHYRAVSVFEYTATDNPYADLNGDNIPEIAVGRWPVRSVLDLQTIIKKTKDWHQNREDSPKQNAYLLAQATDGQNLSFAEQLSNRVRIPLLTLDEIDGVEQLNLDALPEGVTDVVSFTRSELASKINGGTDIISFSGHGSPTSWGFQNIINTNFVRDLENQGDPVLLMPLACFITHYESVSTNTLAHQWLFAGDQGAAAIHGASVLGEYRENGLFAQRYLNQSKTSKTVGEAIMKAKQELGSNNEILHNWTMLGDPTLPIR